MNWESEEAALTSYREAEAAQKEGRHWESVLLFSLSMLHVESYHPNAGYQIAWNLAMLREWELARAALVLVLAKHPDHEGGLLLAELVAVVLNDKQLFA